MGFRDALRRWRGQDDAGDELVGPDDAPAAFDLPPARFIGDFRGTHPQPGSPIPVFRDTPDDEPSPAAPEPGTLVLGTPAVAAADPEPSSPVAPADPAEPAVTADPVASAVPAVPDVPAVPAVLSVPAVSAPPTATAPAAPSVRRPYDDVAPLDASPDYDPTALAEAWALVRDRPDKLVLTFYAELFVRLPEAPRMFPSSMARQRTEFGKAVVQWVAADDPELLRGHLEQLGADHRKFDVEPQHYEVAGQALLSAWRTVAGDGWTDRHEAAVAGSYSRLAHMMLAGAKLHEHEPATWTARVVGHRLIHRDFAVLTVQPDQPYLYRAGQYLTLESPTHRRQWRHMSIASAPRADNCFDLHVRVQGGAGVSAALVRDTGIGGRLTIGPPRGTALVVEPGAATDGLLCIASGTGSAPITAVVEAVLRWPQPPARIDVFVGGRTAADVYGVDILNDVIRTHDAVLRAQAHAVLAEGSGDSGHHGYRGRVEQLVPTLRDWAGLGVEVLVAGPDAMIQGAVANLTLNRVPRGRIHFDQFEAS